MKFTFLIGDPISMRGLIEMNRKLKIGFMLFLALLLHNCVACNLNEILYDTNFDDRAEYISAAASPNFDYFCTIEVNGLPQEESGISLVYNVTILLKDTSMTYENVSVTCMLDNSVHDLLIVPTREFFGTDISEHITLSKENHGLVVGLCTWIDEQVSTVELIGCLEKPFKIKTKWDHSEEYVLMNDGAINLTIHEIKQ